MSREQIIQRILSDAEENAASIISQAQKRAEEIICEADKRAERNRLGTEAEIKEKTCAIADGLAAAARLDSAKVLLSEKRRVIDDIYARAFEKLNALEKADVLRLCEKLLDNYAEDGDEIVFASAFKFQKEVAAFDVVKEKRLKVSPKTSDKVGGGFILRGKNSDKDVSYKALLSEDRERNQVEIAATVF